MMSQYSTGLSSVTNGSPTVTGTSTLWLANVTAGDSFTVAGDGVMYDVASVDSDTQITLSVAYQGVTAAGAIYAIARDFTSPDNFPELTTGDIETPTIITRAFRKIQSRFTGIAINTTAEIGQAVSDHEATNDHPLATTIAKGFLSAVDKTKLDTVESGATADQTKADIDALNIDADTLDGIDSLGFDAAGAADTAVSDHVALADPHAQYAEIAGGAAANFTAMPQVGGDPIVESGSNADGEWTRWSDGAQIAMISNANGEVSGGPYTWTYPAAFNAVPTYAAGQNLTRSSNGPGRADSVSLGMSGTDSRTATDLGYYTSTSSSAARPFAVALFASGRWK